MGTQKVANLRNMRLEWREIFKSFFFKYDFGVRNQFKVITFGREYSVRDGNLLNIGATINF
jgi:hypothetical protein